VKKKIVKSFINIITTDGMPFLFLDSEGFKDIVDSIYNALGMKSIP